jgi:selenocysteine-specific translation elongation factor
LIDSIALDGVDEKWRRADMGKRDESITIGTTTYRYEEQNAQFIKLATHLKHVRSMLKQRHNDIAILTVSRDSLRHKLLELAGDEEVAPASLDSLPDTLSFEEIG